MSIHDEMEELKEAAHEAKERHELAPVSLTMAIVAVLVATVTLLGHRSHTEEILLQNQTTDKWAYYQAKNLRRNNLEALDELLGTLPGQDAGRAEKVHQRFAQDIEKYRAQQADIEKEARNLEAELDHTGRKADRFDLAEVFLEIGLVITSITLLTGRRAFWFVGLVFAATGVAVAATGFLVH